METPLKSIPHSSKEGKRDESCQFIRKMSKKLLSLFFSAEIVERENGRKSRTKYIFHKIFQTTFS